MSALYLALAVYCDAHNLVFVIPILLFLRKKSLATFSILFVTLTTCLHGMALILVGQERYLSILVATTCHSFQIGMAPSLSLLFYFGMELFDRFLSYFTVLLCMPYILIVPVTIRLYRYPIVLVSFLLLDLHLLIIALTFFGIAGCHLLDAWDAVSATGDAVQPQRGFLSGALVSAIPGSRTKDCTCIPLCPARSHCTLRGGLRHVARNGIGRGQLPLFSVFGLQCLFGGLVFAVLCRLVETRQGPANHRKDSSKNQSKERIMETSTVGCVYTKVAVI